VYVYLGQLYVIMDTYTHAYTHTLSLFCSLMSLPECFFDTCTYMHTPWHNSLHSWSRRTGPHTYIHACIYIHIHAWRITNLRSWSRWILFTYIHAYLYTYTHLAHNSLRSWSRRIPFMCAAISQAPQVLRVQMLDHGAQG
jgi:hypothetical protein